MKISKLFLLVTMHCITTNTTKAMQQLSKKDNDPQTLLLYGIINEDVEIVQQAIKNGADAKKKNEKGHSPYYINNSLYHKGYKKDLFCNSSNYSKIRNLLEIKILGPTNAKLLKAIREQNIILIQESLKEGADINCSPEDDEYTPLLEAFRYRSKDIEIIHFLINQKNIDINKGNILGYICFWIKYSTPESNCLQIVQLLIEKSVNPNSIIEGETPLMWACKYYNKYLILLLLKAGATVTEEIRKLILKNNKEIFGLVKNWNKMLDKKINEELDSPIQIKHLRDIIVDYCKIELE